MQRCMIIDRSNVIRKVAKRILGTPEMLMIEADTGATALGMCQAQLPDIIIVDIAMSDMEAESFVRAVRNMEDGDQPKIIMSMSEMDLVKMTRAKRAGANDYLLKPFDRNMLLNQFRQINTRAAA